MSNQKAENAVGPSADGESEKKAPRITFAEVVAGWFAGFSFRVLFAWIFRIVGLCGLLIVYQTVEAEGLRELFSDLMGLRLYRASFLTTWMAGYEETRRLDLANGIAAALMVFSYASWEFVVARVTNHTKGETAGERAIVLIPAVTLMVIDTVLFGVGVYVNGSMRSPIPAILLALAYDAMLVLFAYIVIKIGGKS